MPGVRAQGCDDYSLRGELLSGNDIWSDTKAPLRKRILWKLGIATPIDWAAVEAAYPSEDELNEDPVFNARFAEGIASDFASVTAHMRSVSSEQAKLLSGSLLTLNSAGAFASLQLTMAPFFKALSLGGFVFGIIAGLLSIHLGIRAGIKLTGPIGEALGYWRASAISGYRDRDLEMGHLRIHQKAIAASVAPYFAGYLSIASFALSCVAAAVGLFG